MHKPNHKQQVMNSHLTGTLSASPLSEPSSSPPEPFVCRITQSNGQRKNQVGKHGQGCQGEELGSVHTGWRRRNRREEEEEDEVPRPGRGSASGGAERSETERSETARKSRPSPAAGSAMRRGHRWWRPCPCG
jgi:hypothetical protein